MSGGIVPSVVVPVPWQVIRDYCRKEYDAFIEAWDVEEDSCMEELARAASYFDTRNGCEVKALKHEVEGEMDEAHVDRLAALARAFSRHTGLALYLTYHDSESEGCAGDAEECRDVFWCLDFDEVFQLSPKGVLLATHTTHEVHDGQDRYYWRPMVATYGQYCG